jgi:hypothetical protein
MKEWKTINDFSNYEVSTEGEIRNISSKYILKGRKSKSGYYQVSIKNDITKTFKNQYIHRLVASAFTQNVEDKKEVNHKDGNKLNNHVSNLEWVTSSENQIHRHSIGITKTSNKRVGKFTKDGDLIIEYESIIQASLKENCYRGSIDGALSGRRKTLFGYVWRYLD